jgi:hypothetical protein
MDMTAVRALAQTAAMSVHGVDIAVTVPGGLVAVNTRGLWYRSSDELMPVGRDFSKRDPRRPMAIPLSAELPDVPRGSIIVAAPPGSLISRTWRAETVEHADADEIRLLLAPAD